ncbi:nicotinamide mononucleotide transporter [Haliea sp. E17]|uniref:nicotinamide mononucleotide transporter n=1 Tax=Haliea sp. E17 TaxID=3401576 RepID=UPI003AAB399C
MDLALQLWGGLCYLSNKILFAVSVGQEASLRRQLKIAGWAIYIVGVPAWVIILVGKHDWIAASIEAGGIPAMLLGLYNTIHDHQRVNRLFNRVVSVCTYGSLAFGVLVSLYHHGGLTSLSQLLEIGVMFGFLLGSYLLARNNPGGWLFFMLMNVSMASLMLLQEKHILMGQQLLSLCFVVYGYYKTTGQRVALQ